MGSQQILNHHSGQNKNLIMTIGVMLLIQCNRLFKTHAVVGCCESQSEHLTSRWIDHFHKLTAVGRVSDAAQRRSDSVESF